MHRFLLLLSMLLLQPSFSAAQGDEGMRPAAAAASAGEGEARAEQSPDDLDARLTQVEGPVYVRFSDLPEDSFIPAESEMSISSGDEIRTGAGGSAELVLEGETVIHLASNSDFTVSSLEPKRTEFFLGLGSIVAKVKKLMGGTMEFRTPTVTAAVRGTELGVSEGEGDAAARVGVFDEGRVAVRGHGSEGETVIGPNQESHVVAGRPIGKPQKLQFFQQRRERITKARGRLKDVRKGWKSRPFAQRLQHRQQQRQRPVMQRGALKGLSQEQGRRRYEENRQRMRQLHETRSKARQEKLELHRKKREKRKAEGEHKQEQNRQRAQERQQQFEQRRQQFQQQQQGQQQHGQMQQQHGQMQQQHGQMQQQHGQQNGPGQRRHRPGRQRRFGP